MAKSSPILLCLTPPPIKYQKRGCIFWGMQASCCDVGGRFGARRYKFFKELKVAPKSLLTQPPASASDSISIVSPYFETRWCSLPPLVAPPGWVGLTGMNRALFVLFLLQIVLGENHLATSKIPKSNSISTATKLLTTKWGNF